MYFRFSPRAETPMPLNISSSRLIAPLQLKAARTSPASRFSCRALSGVFCKYEVALPDLPDIDRFGIVLRLPFLRRTMQADRPWQLVEREIQDQRTRDRRIPPRRAT